MKKHLKWLSVLMVLAMLVSMATAVAEDETKYTITINNSAAGHTYEAYQIFAGVYAKDENNQETLSNLTWGSGITDEGKTHFGSDAQDKADTLKVESDARKFANEVVNYLSATKKTSTGPVDDKYTISGLDAGYYLVKDQDESLSGEHDAYSLYLLEVVGNVSTSPKSAVPSFQKKIIDINDSVAGSETDWQDSADHDIGDKIKFQLMGTVTEKYSDFEHYTYAFHDQECSGLTFEASSVKVYVDGVQINDGYVVKTKTDGTCEHDDCTFEIYFADLKKINEVKANSKITVEYESELNSNAIIGSKGNPNVAYLEFANNPYKVGDGENTKGETGETAPDKVIVFTYVTEINKVKENPKYVEGSEDPEAKEQYLPLAGAEFKLEKKAAGENDTWNEITCTPDTNGTTFTFVGIDDGIYRLTETKTPDGFNSIEPIYFTVSAEHEVEADDPTLISLNANQSSVEGEAFTDGVVARFAAVHTDGSVTSDILNLSGSVLPSTGGIGTTIFYALGGLLVVAAAVLLITKRRMSSED